jgi:hypothetical protein
MAARRLSDGSAGGGEVTPAIDEELDAPCSHLRAVRTSGTRLPAAFAEVILARMDSAEATIANVQTLHYAAYNELGHAPICSECHGKAGTHPCGCWSEEDTQAVCAVCRRYVNGHWLSEVYPCPTAAVLGARPGGDEE